MAVNLGSVINAVRNVSPQSASGASVNGASIDCAEVGEIVFALVVGAIDAAATVDCKLQDSADNSTFADITGADWTQIDGTGDDAIALGRLKKTTSINRYVRPVVTVGGTGNALVAVVGVTGEHDTDPQASYDFEV